VDGPLWRWLHRAYHTNRQNRPHHPAAGSNPTSCTFGNAQGGKQLDTLLITSARFGLSQPGPQDGAVLAIHTGHCGMAENRYQDLD
jgi:sugar lactone lactonase YvrE